MATFECFIVAPLKTEVFGNVQKVNCPTPFNHFTYPSPTSPSPVFFTPISYLTPTNLDSERGKYLGRKGGGVGEKLV